MKYYLYNARANNGIAPEFKKDANVVEAVGLDYQKFFDGLKEDDSVVLVGGDGTINYLINHINCDELKTKVYYKAAGTGNDFLNCIGKPKDEEIFLNPYLKNLPTVYVNGLIQKFINGIGYGIDGYCCEEADKIKAVKPNSDINYTGIAIKGLLGKFKPRNAKITVDGVTQEFDHVWLAPSMKGKYYGGGMEIAPLQNRMGEDLTVVVYHTKSVLKSLIRFPSVFKGEHVKYKDMIYITSGKEVEVEFDKPCALQIDGETVLNVKSYKVKA